MHGYGYGYGAGAMAIMMILVIVVIAVLIYVLLKQSHIRQDYNRSGTNNSNISTSNKAMDILNEKLALGEITEEEYTKRKQLINS